MRGGRRFSHCRGSACFGMNAVDRLSAVDLGGGVSIIDALERLAEKRPSKMALLGI